MYQNNMRHFIFDIDFLFRERVFFSSFSRMTNFSLHVKSSFPWVLPVLLFHVLVSVSSFYEYKFIFFSDLHKNSWSEVEVWKLGTKCLLVVWCTPGLCTWVLRNWSLTQSIYHQDSEKRTLLILPPFSCKWLFTLNLTYKLRRRHRLRSTLPRALLPRLNFLSSILAESFIFQN
jgi:hypothetical protein